MTDSHLHLYPHQLPHSAARPVSAPTGHYPVERVEEFVTAAARRDVTRLVFTEHFYRCFESADILGPFWESEPSALAERTRLDVEADRSLSFERYVDVILRAKDAGLPVLLGVEVDFFPDTIDAVMDFLAPYPLDLVVGSVHWIGGFGFDKPHSQQEWDVRGRRVVYEQYFELESALAASGLVDVIAHPDRVKMSGVRIHPEPVDLYEDLVGSAVAGDVAVELNSGGLRHRIGEVYPAVTLQHMFAAAGLDATLASDAHMPADAGWKLDELEDMARAAGFNHLACFEQRKKTREELGRLRAR